MKPITARFESSASNPASNAMRRVVGTAALCSALGREHVARAPHGVQKRLFEPFVELSPETADMDVDDVGAGVEMIVPDLLQKHGPGDDSPLVAGEIFKQQI